MLYEVITRAPDLAPRGETFADGGESQTPIAGDGPRIHRHETESDTTSG